MKLNTLNRIIKWFEEYQPDLKNGIELYGKLIDEEFEEYMTAKKNNDIVEILDGLGDLLWVMTGEQYFNENKLSLHNDNYITIKSLLNSEFPELKDVDNLLDDLINEIADSNFTKCLELQTDGEKIGKVIKGPDFKKPDIQKIINKYNYNYKL